MTRKSLIHEVARATAKDIVEVFAGCLREEELHDAFVEVLMSVKTSLHRFRIEEKRLERRMLPGPKNVAKASRRRK